MGSTYLDTGTGLAPFLAGSGKIILTQQNFGPRTGDYTDEQSCRFL
jgi:hypothetical protein